MKMDPEALYKLIPPELAALFRPEVEKFHNRLNSDPEYIEINRKIDEAVEKIVEVMKTGTLSIYEGECGFKLEKFEDPIAQNFLDKHLPRGLNQHATDVTNIFNRLTFKQLQETNDGYLMRALLSDPILWLFMVKDADFQAFMRKDIGEKSAQEYVDYLISDSFGEKYREIITYCFS